MDCCCHRLVLPARAWPSRVVFPENRLKRIHVHTSRVYVENSIPRERRESLAESGEVAVNIAEIARVRAQVVLSFAYTASSRLYFFVSFFSSPLAYVSPSDVLIHVILPVAVRVCVCV